MNNVLKIAIKLYCRIFFVATISTIILFFIDFIIDKYFYMSIVNSITNYCKSFSIPDNFIDNTIVILTIIATGTIALLAILTTLNSNNLEKTEVENIKKFLESVSKQYKSYAQNYIKVYENIDNIKVILQKYNLMYENFLKKIKHNDQLNHIYSTLSDLSFTCLFIATFLVFLTAKIHTQSNILFTILALLLTMVYVYIWTYYKVNLLPILQIKEYKIDFPTFEKLVSLHEQIIVPYANVNSVLPLKLFSLSSFFRIHENFYSNIESIDLVTLSEYNINRNTKITITYSSQINNQSPSEESFLLGDIPKKESNGYIYYSLKPSNNSIISFTITIQNQILNQSCETSLIYRLDENSEYIFICKYFTLFKNEKQL